MSRDNHTGAAELPEALRLANAVEQFGGATAYQAAAELRRLHAQVEALQGLAATCYAGLGAECNLPENWLDVFNAAANGEPFSTEGLLPYTAAQPEALKDHQIAELPQALRLADALDAACILAPDASREAAAELRRLHQSEREGWRHADELKQDLDRLRAQVEALSAAQAGVPAEQTPELQRMTAHRAIYFMERFLKEEKLLGPNEQAALHFAIAMLAAAPQPSPSPAPADQWVEPVMPRAWMQRIDAAAEALSRIQAWTALGELEGPASRALQGLRAIQSSASPAPAQPGQEGERLEILAPNASGNASCIVRWLIETPQGWVGAWNTEALEYLIARAAQQPATADAARNMFDAGWKAAARFCDRDDVVADGIIGFGACPQFETAFDAAIAAQQGGAA